MSGEAQPTGRYVTLSPEALAARKRRSMLTALALFAFVVLVFSITMVRLGASASGLSKAKDFSHALGQDAPSSQLDAEEAP